MTEENKKKKPEGKKKPKNIVLDIHDGVIGHKSNYGDNKYK